MKIEAIVMSVAIDPTRHDRQIVKIKASTYSSDVEITTSDDRFEPRFTIGQIVNVEITNQ